jgi:Rieske Fe-S protein
MNEDRRAFIKQTCRMCAALAGVAIVLPSVTACAPLKTVSADISEGSISVPASSFTEGNNLVIVRNNDLDFDIALVKYADNSYRSFLLECTHRSNPLVATQTGFTCNLHGSSFDLKGAVTKPPATSALKEYPVQASSEILKIKIRNT